MLKGAINPDAAAALDPYLYCLGVALTCAGLMLSQIHRDEGQLLLLFSGVTFNLFRKVSALMLLISLPMGFWVMGWWWVIGLAASILLASVPVIAFRHSPMRLGATFVFFTSGLPLMFWAQSPIISQLVRG